MYSQKEIHERFDRLEKLLLFQKKKLTVTEVAAYTGYKESYIYRLTASRKIPFSKPSGGACFFDRDEIDEWLSQNPIATENQMDQKVDNFRLK